MGLAVYTKKEIMHMQWIRMISILDGYIEKYKMLEDMLELTV